MLATLICAGLVCAGSLLVGQAVLKLCGSREWSWVSGPVGLSVLMLVAVPALHAPGRATTVAVALAVLLVASAVVVLRDAAMRPPLLGLLAGLPVALLVFVPFISAGHSGTLGVSFNNDMAAHLGWAEAYRSADVAKVLEVSGTYPLGPHALVGALAQGLGVAVDHAFAGLTAALPILLGLTALAALSPQARWPARAAVATLVGIPFLVAGYYMQGSFKELAQVLLVLGFTLELRRFGESGSRARWVPLALLAVGTISVYSYVGLIWPLAIAGVWLAGLAVRSFPLSREALAGAVRPELGPLLLAGALAVLLLVPQLPRMVRFYDLGTGIAEDSLGNLIGRLPVWEAFGVWGSPDYRLPSVDQFHAGMWSALALALVVAGGVWWLRRGDWLVPAAAVTCLGLWFLSDRTSAPYATAKTLVIASPFVMLVAIRPLVELGGRAFPSPRSWMIAARVLAVVLVLKGVDSSWQALRLSLVGPRDHLVELRGLRPMLGTQPTLFLGNDDFIRWELAGVPVQAPIIGHPRLPPRPEKALAIGYAMDFDTLDAPVLNTFNWVITTRDAAGSAPPPQMKLVRRTRNFEVWRRTGTVVHRDLLKENDAPAARLDCRTPEGRALRRGDGVAATRLGPVGVPAPTLLPGATTDVKLNLGAGTWDIVMPYVSPRKLRVSMPGLRATLPPHVDRPGPRWPVGRITLAGAQRVSVRVHADEGRFTSADSFASPGAVIAVPAFGARTVPLREACGELVDWYRPSG